MASSGEAAAAGEIANPTDVPFAASRLDDLLAQAGIDVLIASSKHNLQYLLGGYRFFFFDHFDAIGVSRYLPLLLYFRGRPERSVYIGSTMERWEAELDRFWVPQVETATWGTVDAMERAVRHLRGSARKLRIGVERDFLPASAEEVLRRAFPDAELCDAMFPLERLRAQKSALELRFLREASERVVASMLEVFSDLRPGMTKSEVAEALRREEVGRGLVFEYCLIAAGSSRNRAPSDQVIAKGDVVSLDSGANYRGYIGDLCRMAVLGDPDAELEALLGDVDAVQQAARAAIRPGATGTEIFAAAEERRARSSSAERLEFVAHGMGLVSHEAPRLTDGSSLRYPGYDRDRPLQPGMVISVETSLAHPVRGFVKLEDTIAVTEHGFEAFGDGGRGWNRAGH